MKKFSLLCAVAIAGLSLTACGNSTTSHKSHSKAVSSSKVIKHHKHHSKKVKKDKQSSSSSSSSATSASNQQQQQNQQKTQASANSRQVDKSDPSTWNNIPYKGYASYNAYLQANNGDPDIQAETARMQHEENMRQGIEDSNGNETQNFQNWVNDRDNAWNNGNNNFPDYDQNKQW